MKTIIKELPHHKLGLSYTATGYGDKIPTRYMVKLGNRFYRIYCACFGNVGTLYVVRQGQKQVIKDYDLELDT